MSDSIPEYSFEQKERLARRIQKIRKQKYLYDIEDIILKHNPDLDVTTNPSGKFMYFQDLSKETYYALDKYIRKLLKLQTLSESENTQYSSEITRYSEDEDPFSNNLRLRYSNKEKNLIKRKIYDDQINNQTSENINSTDNDNIEISEEQIQNNQQNVINLNQSQNNVFVKRNNLKQSKNNYITQ